MNYFGEMSQDYEEMKKNPDYIPRYPEMMETYEEKSCHEKNRDRYEHQYYKVCHDVSLLTKTQKEWPYIKTVGQVRQRRIPLERDAEGNDITPDVETFLKKGSRRKPKPSRVESCSSIMTEAMDDFCDDHTLIEKYVFSVIKSFY